MITLLLLLSLAAVWTARTYGRGIPEEPRAAGLLRTGLLVARADAAAALDALRARMKNALDKSDAIQAGADASGRDLTKEEADQVRQLHADFDLARAELERREQAAARREILDGPVNPGARAAIRGTPGIEAGSGPAAPKGRADFRSFGEFLRCIKNAANGQIDGRLQPLAAAPSSYGSEGTNADGGYAVPPDFRNQITSLMFGEQDLLALCDQVTTPVNSMVFPIDENSPWSGSGIQVAWETEAQQKTPSKPVLGEFTVRAHKLSAIVPMTEELLTDAPTMESYISGKVADKLAFKINDAIVNGTGQGQPRGLLSAPCKIAQAAEGGQSAGTINFQNVIKMRSRMWARGLQKAVWLVNADAMVQLMALTFPNAAGSTVAFPAFMPAGGVSGAPYDTLFGRPIIPVESCAALGTEGDIIFADLSQYIALLKAGGLKQDVSIHLWFDYDITAFKFVMRMGGQPWWSAALTRNKGNSVSPVVTLAAR